MIEEKSSVSNFVASHPSLVGFDLFGTAPSIVLFHSKYSHLLSVGEIHTVNILSRSLGTMNGDSYSSRGMSVNDGW